MGGERGEASVERVLLAHGGGGRKSAQLISGVMLAAFDNPALSELADGGVVELGGVRIAVSTDSHIVSPIFFPGGDIGSLAVWGTVNDLAMCGATTGALAFAVIAAEGFPMDDLRRVVRSAGAAAERAGFAVITGDTKVVPAGEADGLFVTTTGVGPLAEGVDLRPARVRPGDAVLLSGPVGEHGVAVLSEREGLSFTADVSSDSAPLSRLVEDVLAACSDVHAMRDPTRGGVAAVLNEIAARAGVSVEIDEAAVPISDAVSGACELLGLDPLALPSEGRCLVFLPEADAGAALAAMRGNELGGGAVRIGSVTAGAAGMVSAATPVGGRRIVDMPPGELLPRIC